MIARAERWLFRPAPPTRLAILRILVGVYAVIFLISRFPNFWSSADLPDRQFEPVGVLVPVGGPWSSTLARALVIIAIPLGVLFISGRWFRVVGPAFSLAFLVVTTYRLSWGHVIHTEHLPALHLLVLGFAPSAAAWSWGGRRDARAQPRPDDHERFSFPVQVMALITIMTYMLAGIAKLRNGGGDWLVGDVLRNQVAYDNLRKELLGSWHSPLGGRAVRYGWMFPPFAIATVVVELGAPIAFLGGRWRTRWVAAAWGFHVGIAALMWISFPYPLVGLAYAPLFRVERLGERLIRRGRWPWRRGDLQGSPRESSAEPHSRPLADVQFRAERREAGTHSPRMPRHRFGAAGH